MQLKHKSMKTFTLLAFTGFAYSFSMAQYTANADSLSQNLQRLLNEHPALTAAQQKILSAQEAIDVSKAEYYPALSVTGEAGYNKLSTPSGREADTVETYQQQVAEVEIRQNLFSGLSTVNSVESGAFALEVSKFSYAQTIQKQLFAGAKGYLEVIRSRELLDIATRKIETIRSQMELEDERVRSGTGVSVDVLQAKSRLQKAKDQYFRYERQLDRALASFERAFSFAMHKDQITADDVSDQILVPASIEQAIEIAQSGNPDIHKTEQDAAVVYARIAAARSGYAPSIDLVGTHEWSRDDSGIDGITTESRAYVEMSWDLFSGFATMSEIARLSNNWGEALSNIDDARLEVNEAIHTAWGKLEHANKQNVLYENGLVLAKELLDARTKLRESGKETALGVLDAQNELYQAEISKIGALYDARVAAYELASAIGILTPESIGLQTPNPETLMQSAKHSKSDYQPDSVIMEEETDPMAPFEVDEEEAPMQEITDSGAVELEVSSIESALPVQPLALEKLNLTINGHNTPLKTKTHQG